MSNAERTARARRAGANPVPQPGPRPKPKFDVVPQRPTEGGQDGNPPTKHRERPSGEPLTLEAAERELERIVDNAPIAAQSTAEDGARMLTEANTLIYVRQPTDHRPRLSSHFKKLLKQWTDGARPGPQKPDELEAMAKQVLLQRNHRDVKGTRVELKGS